MNPIALGLAATTLLACTHLMAAPGQDSGGTTRDVQTIIDRHCIACHGPGLLEAPRVGDSAAWKTRADKEGGLDGLLARTLSGISIMPPKGSCADCSDAELKAAIQKMSGL